MNISLTHKIREREKKISTLKQIFSVKLTIFLLNSRVYKGNADTTLTLAATSIGAVIINVKSSISALSISKNPWEPCIEWYKQKKGHNSTKRA